MERETQQRNEGERQRWRRGKKETHAANCHIPAESFGDEDGNDSVLLTETAKDVFSQSVTHAHSFTPSPTPLLIQSLTLPLIDSLTVSQLFTIHTFTHSLPFPHSNYSSNL